MNKLMLTLLGCIALSGNIFAEKASKKTSKNDKTECCGKRCDMKEAQEGCRLFKCCDKKDKVDKEKTTKKACKKCTPRKKCSECKVKRTKKCGCSWFCKKEKKDSKE